MRVRLCVHMCMSVCVHACACECACGTGEHTYVSLKEALTLTSEQHSYFRVGVTKLSNPKCSRHRETGTLSIQVEYLVFKQRTLRTEIPFSFFPRMVG